MAEQDDLLRDLQQEAAAISRLARDEDKFRALFDAFRAEDTESFQRLLRELELAERCQLVCSWLCSKECVLLCLELCGPPPAELPDLRQFAEVVVRIASDEELVERLANSVAERDAGALSSLVKELGAEPFCHLLCHWVCTIRCRLICQLVCGPPPPRRPQLAEELTKAVEPLRRLLADEKLFEAAAEAVRIGNCERLRGVIQEVRLVDFCEIICVWICTWRCLWLCLRFCRPFPPEKVDTSLTEAFEFAKVTARLAEDPKSLERLTQALSSSDVGAWEAAVKELQLERFCIQLCHWFCFRWCELFCFCVCPPIPQPWFTHVGHFDIYADIDITTGKTNKGLTYAGLYFNGGPQFGFQGCLELRGFCPATSPTIPGVPMRYRFLYEHPAGTKVPLTRGLLCPVDAGTRQILWPQNVGGIAGASTVPTFQTVKIQSAPAADPVPPAVGASWYGPSEHVIVPDIDGWINVDPAAIGGGFTTLIGFDTTQVIPGGDASLLAGVSAGNPVPAGNQKNGTGIGIIFEATRIPGPTSPPDFSNSLAKIHINNWGEVNLLDLAQFHTAGGTSCSPLSAALDIEYTADHELMAGWSVTLDTAAVQPLPGSPVFPSGADTRGALPPPAPPQPPPPVPPPPPWPWAGTDHYDISRWPTCSYTVRLNTRAGLTTGLIDNQGKSKEKTFCIGGQRRVP